MTTDNARAEIVEQARAAVEELANTRMEISIERWSVLSGAILAALDHMHPATPPASAGEVEDLRAKMRMIVSHATGGASSDIDRSTNDICVDITRKVNRVWEAAQEAALSASSRHEGDRSPCCNWPMDDKGCTRCGTPAPERPEPVEGVGRHAIVASLVRDAIEGGTDDHADDAAHRIMAYLIEPVGCPMPGACSASALTLPANAGTDGEHNVARFFFEIGYGACWADAYIAAGKKAPFPLTDAGMDRAWEIAPEATDDPVEFDRMLALTLPPNAGAGDSEKIQAALDWIKDHCTCHELHPCDQNKGLCVACKHLAALSPAAGREGEI